MKEEIAELIAFVTTVMFIVLGAVIFLSLMGCGSSDDDDGLRVVEQYCTRCFEETNPITGGFEIVCEEYLTSNPLGCS